MLGAILTVASTQESPWQGAQQAVSEWTSAIPAWAVLLAVAVVAAYVGWRRTRASA